MNNLAVLEDLQRLDAVTALSQVEESKFRDMLWDNRTELIRAATKLHDIFEIYQTDLREYGLV